MKPIRIGPMSPPSTRHRDDHWASAAHCATDHGIEIMDMAHDHVSAVPFAKRLCGNCPVAAQCLRDNLAEPLGVWGGTDPDERAAMRGDTGPDLPPLPCAWCEREFTPANPKQRLYCGAECRTAARYAMNRRAGKIKRGTAA